MDAADLDACRRAYDAYSRGDFETLLTLFAPDVVVYVAPPNFEAGTYRGHDEYLGLIERWGAAWDQMRAMPQKISHAGEWIMAEVEYFGRGKGSDIEVTQPSWELSSWSDGLCRRYEVYFDGREGREVFEGRAAEAGAQPQPL